MKNFSKFEEKIGISFNDQSLLRRAFTHRSYLNENQDQDNEMRHNERLEFLGDAVLELVVTEFLFSEYSNRPEGELTAIRAALVNTVTLSEAADQMGMNEFLLLSKGEAKDTGRARQFILANTFEAVIGAIYLDGGYDAAQKFIADTIFPLVDDIVEQDLWQDAKSKFQEEAQEHVSITPTYKTLKESGPDHDKQFTIGVYLRTEKVAEGEGKSKQEAEQEAARVALEKHRWA